MVTSDAMTVDEETIEALRQIHSQLKLDEEAPYDLEPTEWADRAEKSSACSLLFDTDSLLQKFLVFKEKLSKRFKRSKDSVLDEVVPEIRDDCKPGDEMTQELTDAWTLYTRGSNEIPSKQIGYVLRILGQNPTEDDIVEMVMKADCDWEGTMNMADFLTVAQEILRNSCNQLDDVKAAFRVFDYDNDGSISKEELREAMVNLGQRCTEEEFAVMFAEADKNKNGRIDFDEFVDMMLPGTNCAI